MRPSRGEGTPTAVDYQDIRDDRVFTYFGLDAGQEIRVERLPTHFGELNLTVRGTNQGVEVKFDPPKRNPPRKIVLTLPKSRPLVGTLAGVQLAERADGTQTVTVPDSFSGDLVQCYMAYITADGQTVSNSAFAGAVTVA